MSRDQFVFLAFAAGVLVYTFGPSVIARIRAWLAPEPLAPFSRYQDIDR